MRYNEKDLLPVNKSTPNILQITGKYYDCIIY